MTPHILIDATILVTMSKSSNKDRSQQSFRFNSKANIDLAERIQEQATTLQRALELKLTLRRIVDTVRNSLDEVHILKTAVRELALELKAVCYASLNPRGIASDFRQISSYFWWRSLETRQYRIGIGIS